MREAVATVLATRPHFGHPHWAKENLTNYANKSGMCVCMRAPPEIRVHWEKGCCIIYNQ